MIARHRWIPVFAVAALLAVAWAIATPLFASPDEPAHVVKAAGVVRGQLVGENIEGEEGEEVTWAQTMRLPAVLASSHDIGCFAFEPDLTADCFDFAGSTETTDVVTTAGRHPPFYYASAGLPSLADVESKGVYAMRLVSALVTAGFLAAAWTVLGHLPRPRTARLGLAVAVTPMVLFLAGVVNPNAWEVGAAVLLWSAGLAAVSGKRSPSVVHAAGIASVVLALTRQLGPLWLVLILASLGVLGSSALLRELWRRRDVRTWSAATATAVIAQGAWTVIARPLDTERSITESVHTAPFQDMGTVELVRESFGHVGLYFYEMLGVFGWRDTTPPEWTYIVWTAAIFGLVMLGIALGRRRDTIVLVGVGVVAIVVPVVAVTRAAREVGFFWQGRYTLPLAVGIPLVAAWAVARRVAVPGRALVVVGVALASAQALAFAQALRRYAAGARSDNLQFWNGAAWTPPVPIVVLLVSYLALAAAWYWLHLGTGPRQRDPSPEEEPTGGVAADDMEEERVEGTSDAALDWRAPSAVTMRESAP